MRFLTLTDRQNIVENTEERKFEELLLRGCTLPGLLPGNVQSFL
jgi:hypothetical protein